jgi:two-component system sensor histidine kinase/response regulator
MERTILYVDDDAANLTVLQAACSDEFNVVTAESAEAALEIMRQHEIAVLLVDQRMPGMSGVELFEATREHFPDTVRILITAYSDLTDAINAINRGQVRGYLRKPWDPVHLKATLREGLEVYDTRRKVRDLERRLLETERVYSLGVVAASVAHELRTPLTALLTNLDLAEMRLKALLDTLRSGRSAGAGEVDAGSKAIEQIERAKQVVGQITEITSGIELSHRRRDDDRTADMREVANLTLRCVRAELLKRAQIQVDIEPGPPVQGSPTKLGQVVMNLLINALQALPDRPRGQNLVSLRLRPAGEFVRLEVEDNGSGIPENVLGQIFDPFFTTKAHGGTGLGLAISRQIVEEVHGRIAVESEVGRGTRFSVEIPVAVPAKVTAG